MDFALRYIDFVQKYMNPRIPVVEVEAAFFSAQFHVEIIKLHRLRCKRALFGVAELSSELPTFFNCFINKSHTIGTD